MPPPPPPTEATPPPAAAFGNPYYAPPVPPPPPGAGGQEPTSPPPGYAPQGYGPEGYGPHGYHMPPLSYHEELRPRYGLMVAGGVVLAVSWTISASIGYMIGEWRLQLPVLGPFLEAGHLRTDGPYDANRPAVMGLVFDGMVQVAGLTMVLVGALTKQKVRVLDHHQMTLAPVTGPSFAGLALRGAF